MHVNNNLSRFLLLGILTLGLAGGALPGETLYVTDQLSIHLRTGESNAHRILRMLPSGTPVELVRSNKETGYSLVRVKEQEGYVLTNQLLNEPATREQLTVLKERLAELQKAPDQLGGRLAQLQQDYTALQAAHDEMKRAKQQLEQELESIHRVSTDAVRIANERAELRQTVATLTRRVEDLKQENQDLSNQTSQNWFLIGAGVLGGGILLGLLLPHLRFQRRKTSWGSL